MNIDFSWPPEWISLKERLCDFEGIIMVIAPADRGKTTLVKLIADFLKKCGRDFALVDSDLGQSVVGPPTTIGMLPPGRELELKEALFTPYFRFVGDTTPSRHLLLTALSVFEMVQMARRLARVILVDTCGLFRGLQGLYLKMLKIRLLMPQLVIGLGREEEFEIFKALEMQDFLLLPPPTGLRDKSWEERKNHRCLLFAEYFSRGKNLVVELSRLRLFHPLSPYFYLHRFSSSPKGVTFQLGRKKYHILDSEIGQKIPVSQGSEECWVFSHEMRNLLCCLYSAKLQEVGLGIIKKIDFSENKVEVWGTPVFQAEPHFLVCGDLRITPTGEEVGRFSWKILR